MRRIQIIAAAAIFLALSAVKLLAPGGAALLQARCGLFISRDTNYVEVARAVKSLLRPDETPDMPAESTPPVSVEARSAPSVEPAGLRALGRGDGENGAQTLRAQVAQAMRGEADAKPEDEPSPEPTETPEELPAAVQTFLDSQAAFSDYALPANVTYTWLSLPFSYSAPVAGYQSSGFGYRLHPILNEVRFHYGTDFAANAGETVSAFAGGTVTFAGYSDSYGNYLTIAHDDGWQTLYAHCSKLLVQSGDTVSEGDAVALVGSTGLATGPHLHFELTQNGVYTNPEYYANS